MLRLVLSRASGGKTTYIHNRIKELVDCGCAGNIILLVPEQYSFVTERMMLEKLGAAGACGVEVLSFTRLANSVFSTLGWEKGRRLSEAGKILLMGRALRQCTDRLKVYSKSASSPSVVREMLSLSEEFCQCAVSVGDIERAMNQMEDGLLKSKLSDISLVLSVYQTYMSDGYFDESNLLTALAKKLSGSDWFNGKTVFIDAFRGFTAQELEVIGQILSQARDVFVTLTAPDLEECSTDDIFYHTKKTANKLKRQAALHNVPVAKPVITDGASNGKNSALSALEKNFLSPSAPVFDGDCGNIAVCAAPDIHDECAFAAAWIKRLLRTGEYRSRDIAVIMRDEQTYAQPIKSALAKCGVPVFEDRRQPIINQPLITLVRGALRIADRGFETDSVLRCLKTGLCSLDTQQVSDIENYTYLWQINGQSWLDEWTSDPDGFGEPSKDCEERLKELNSLRSRAVEPFVRFRNSMKNTTGKRAAESVFALLCELETAQSLKELAIALEDSGETAIALETERLWDVLCELLDTAAQTLGDAPVTAGQFCDYFDLMLSTCTLGEIPQGLNEITVGGAQRIRPTAPKTVFILGANAGAFPLSPSQGGVLNIRDRMALSQVGIETAVFGEESVAEERFIAYSACCCASEKLVISFPSKGADGGELSESEIVTFIKEHFPSCTRVDTLSEDPLLLAEGKEPAFELTASLMRSGGELYESLREYFSADAGYAGRLKALDNAAGERSFKIESGETARRLFGENLNLSPSRAETFYRCPFSYFCRYGIDLRERKPASFDPLQKGTVIHLVLEKMLSKYTPQELCELTDEERLGEIRKIMDGYLSKYLDRAARSDRFIYLYERLAKSVDEVVARIAAEFLCSDFRPVDVELSIAYDGDVSPYTLKMPSGGSVRFSGKVDRVDSAVVDGRKYIRVIDYKSSGKPFAVADVLSGLNMQMLIYLFTLIKNGTGRYGESLPAGVLYMPAKAPAVTLERGAEVSADKKKQKACRMQGIVLENAGVVLAMDNSGEGVFVPANIDKNGDVKGSVIGLDELSKLWERVDSLLIDMGEELHGGNISALPAQGKRYKDICSKCEFWDICTRESGMPVREIDEDAKIGGDENER